MAAYDSTRRIAKILTSLGIARSAFKANAAYIADVDAFATFVQPEGMQSARDHRQAITDAGLGFRDGGNCILVSLPKVAA